HADPMAEGLAILARQGNLTDAALCFEAAVQRDPDNNEGWTLLGQVQAENEKELPAIAALQRAVQQAPQNARALMALAVSYTNEGRDRPSYATLGRWLQVQYPSMVPEGALDDPAAMRGDALHDRMTQYYIAAARAGPQARVLPPRDASGAPADIDADVQIGLGVLFYNSGAYDKAVDCFRAALRQDPQNHLLWNRLGATLANSGQSEDAIEAYERALALKPRFTRARYNLGVSCISIGCYKQAAEHLLDALSLHERPPADGARPTTHAGIRHVSSSLWETLRRAFILMDRRDLVDRSYSADASVD
ncbi:hypothetical protein CXG81DRAFT_4567, partial [Caulochytrium protostelioides]